jgi:hypothetical protein
LSEGDLSGWEAVRHCGGGQRARDVAGVGLGREWRSRKERVASRGTGGQRAGATNVVESGEEQESHRRAEHGLDDEDWGQRLTRGPRHA